VCVCVDGRMVERIKKNKTKISCTNKRLLNIKSIVAQPSLETPANPATRNSFAPNLRLIQFYLRDYFFIFSPFKLIDIILKTCTIFRRDKNILKRLAGPPL